MSLIKKNGKPASSVANSIGVVTKWMSATGAVVLSIMMLITVADVTGRYLFNSPIYGSYELVGLLLACAGTWGFAYCEFSGSHIGIDFLVNRLSERAQAILKIFATLLTLIIISLITWQFLLAVIKPTTVAGEISEDLLLPLMPFRVIVLIAYFMFAIAVLISLIRSLKGVTKC